MKKLASIFIFIIFLSGTVTGFALDAKITEAKPAKKTVFNAVSDYLSTLNRPFSRPGNKQGFWQATADWLKTINKE